MSKKHTQQLILALGFALLGHQAHAADALPFPTEKPDHIIATFCGDNLVAADKKAYNVPSEVARWVIPVCIARLNSATQEKYFLVLCEHDNDLKAIRYEVMPMARAARSGQWTVTNPETSTQSTLTLGEFTVPNADFTGSMILTYTKELLSSANPTIFTSMVGQTPVLKLSGKAVDVASALIPYLGDDRDVTPDNWTP